MITIDQLKAAMSLKSQFQPDDEKTVGTWRNTKSATGVYSATRSATKLNKIAA